MDNSQDEARKLNPFFVEDLSMGWTFSIKGFSNCRLIAQLNNLFAKKYEPNGYTYNYVFNNKLTTENGYYPMAGRNFMVGLNVSF
jgi:iron complex outermembrane receptor protein